MATHKSSFLMNIYNKIFILVAVSFLLTGLSAAQQKNVRGVGVKIKVENGADLTLYDESHALVIGVSDYNNGWPKLPGVKNDIKAVSDALRKQGFEVEEVPNPTRQIFEEKMKNFIFKYGQSPGNRLLIYFAGHGETLTTSDGRSLGYIVPKDAPLPAMNIGAFKQIAISMDEIEGYALKIESKHALFVFDSCFSGSLFESSRSTPPAITSRVAQPVRQFITAGTEDQEVPDRSIFREQFVEGLNGEADLNSDGYVTGSELGMFLEDRVTNYTHRSQTPRWGKIRYSKLDKGDFVFVLPKALDEQIRIEAPKPPPQLNPQPVDPTVIELSYWDTIKNSSNPEDFRAYLDTYPNGKFARLAKNRLNVLTASAQPGDPASIPFHISSVNNSAFAYAVICDGEYRIYPKSVEVKVKGMTIYVRDSNSYRGQRIFDSIKLGLVTRPGGSIGLMTNTSQDISVGKTMMPGDRYNLDSLLFSIPKDSSMDLSKYFLSVQIKDITFESGKPSAGYIYADSEPDIFAQKKPSITEQANSTSRSSTPEVSPTPIQQAPILIPVQQAPPPLQIQHGPIGLAPNTMYLLNDKRTPLVFRAMIVDTNDEQQLAAIAQKVTTDISWAGSHAWDDKWYYWRIPTGRNLLLAWGTPYSVGWILVQRNQGTWWYKLNSGQWNTIRLNKSKREYWVINGTRISITIEAPTAGNGWTSDDIKYKFGF